MIDFLDMDSNKLVISEFYENEIANKYEYATKYQREIVWSEEKKSFLIDTILKNYPIPPIFLRMKINPDTGATCYDVIDGKQRLTTIKAFIEGDICLPDDFSGDGMGIPELDGASFEQLNNHEAYKRQFWRYRIPVIFVETDNDEVIRNIFDRLNRNGEPLEPQELRHAKYGETKLYRLIEKIAADNPWKELMNRILETGRMEDKEFLSELLFLIFEKKILNYTKGTLDDLYKKWSENDFDEDHFLKEFMDVMDYIEKMQLDFKICKIEKVSPLYTLWTIGILGMQQVIDPIMLGEKLSIFYRLYIDKNEELIGYDDYKRGMSSSTKGNTSRYRRLNGLIEYCKSEGIIIENSFIK